MTLYAPRKSKPFSNKSLSRSTVPERTCDLATSLYAQLWKREKDFVAFSLADTAQLSVFIRGVDSNMCVTEELLRFIPQESPCGKALKMEHVMTTVTQVDNLSVVRNKQTYRITRR